MPLKYFLCFILIFSLIGCAATGAKKTTVIPLEAQLNEARVQLQEKDEKIQFLEDELSHSRQTSYNYSSSKQYSKFTPKQIQAALKNAGYYDGPIDGKIGKNTKKAIKAFQGANGLVVDGVVGKQTSARLKKYLK